MTAPKKSIFKLDASKLSFDFFENAVMLGLSSDLASYQLCHALNQAFNLSFFLNPSVTVKIGHKDASGQVLVREFPVFQTTIPFCNSEYFLYKLKLEEAHLMPEIKNIDYIWLFKADCFEDALEQAELYLPSLKTIQGIQFSTMIEDLFKLKSIQNLIL